MSKHKEEDKKAGGPAETSAADQATAGSGSSATTEAAAAKTTEQLLSEKDARIKGLEDQYLRLRADFDNFRKRNQAEREELIKFANEILVTSLLAVLDNFNRAMTTLDELDVSPELDKVVKGIALVHRQFEDIMGKAGLTKIEAVGKHFDPFYHEAALDKKTDQAAEGTVLEEIQAGYLYNGKVIRPAMVVVAKGL